MKTQFLCASCFNILRIPDGFWGSGRDAICHYSSMGNVLQKYRIKNPSGFCYHAPTREIGALDTDGRFFLINTVKNTVCKLDTQKQCESRKPILVNNQMLWIQWNGVVRSYDFTRQELKRITELGGGANVFTRGYTYDEQKHKLHVLFSYPPDLKTYYALVDPVSGDVQMSALPSRHTKDLWDICLYDGALLCLRHRHPALFLLSMTDFSVQKIIKLRQKLWTANSFFWDAPRNTLYIWHSTEVVKVEMETLRIQTIWKDEYISDVFVTKEGDICIGTWEKGVIMTQ